MSAALPRLTIMAPAQFKDLCIDALDAERIGRFYGELLHLEFRRQDGPDGYLSGPTKQHTIWINQVPEPHTAKNRMHLDLNVTSIEPIIALGATVLDELERWTVLADPEGGEFCVFVRDEEPEQPLYEINFDSADPKAQARWWADLLGSTAQDDPEGGHSWVEPIPGAPFSAICFVAVPEPKTVKNRVHLDVTTDDLDGIIAAGGTVLRPSDGDIDWTVMADPEGNEFCAFT